MSTPPRADAEDCLPRIFQAAAAIDDAVSADPVCSNPPVLPPFGRSTVGMEDPMPGGTENVDSVPAGTAAVGLVPDTHLDRVSAAHPRVGRGNENVS
jgi:hypothetical protein